MKACLREIQHVNYSLQAKLARAKIPPPTPCIAPKKFKNEVTTRTFNKELTGNSTQDGRECFAETVFWILPHDHVGPNEGRSRICRVGILKVDAPVSRYRALFKFVCRAYDTLENLATA